MVFIHPLFGLIPALILFLYGIEHFSKEIQLLTGKKFRVIIGKLTNTPVKGAFLGAIITGIIQSSTATTVITVSLVNAGILSFTQSLGIIFGANVGTTITAQLVALKLTAFAPVFIVFGFLLKVFGKRFRILGKCFFYFGLVFYALSLVSVAVEPIKSDPYVMTLFANLSNVWWALLVGFLFTAIVQSSSVTTGLIVVLGGSGLIDLRAGIPLLLGANIGTSVTALIASISLSLHSKRVAIANILFNLIGAILLLPFLGSFLLLIQNLGGNVSRQIANAHLIFNVLAAIIFLIFVKYFKLIVEKIIPGNEEEILFKTKYLEEKLPESNDETFSLIKDEIKNSMDVTLLIFSHSLEMFKKPTKTGFVKLRKLEDLNDFLDERVEDAILKVSSRELIEGEAKKTVLLVQITNTLETLGDLGKDLGNVSEDLFVKGRKLPLDSITAVTKLFTRFKTNLIKLKKTFPSWSPKLREELKGKEEEILSIVNTLYKDHLKRLQKETGYNGSSFVESISVMENAVFRLRQIRKLLEKYSKV